jgi:sugar phosphate isomerase/epimerase
MRRIRQQRTDPRTMRIGIDSYCYRRFFGEIYPELESDPGRRMTLADFIDEASALGAQGVSIESFMLPDTGAASIDALRAALDAAGVDRVWAWGHPRGLESGQSAAALDDLLRHVDVAHALGAGVMRICAGGRHTRNLPWPAHRALLLPMLKRAADYAARRGVVLAVENHIDLLTGEMLELMTTLDHPALGICLDTANNLRMLEDPMQAVEAMAPYARAVHLKDVAAFRGSPRDFAFWPSVPLGKGLIDIPRVLAALRRSAYQGLLALEIDYLHPAYGDEASAIAQSIEALVGMLQERRG